MALSQKIYCATYSYIAVLVGNKGATKEFS